MTTPLDLFGGAEIVPTVSKNKSGNYSGLLPKDRVEAKFLEFWDIYPKRTGSNCKWKAGESFHRLVKAGENPETIIAGARRFVQECSRNGTAGRFVPMAATWLNQRRYKDDPDASGATVSGPQSGGNSFLDIANQLYDSASYHDEQDGDRRY